MPEEYKEFAIKCIEDNIPRSDIKAWSYLDGIINFIKQGKYDEEIWQEFLNKIKVHDEYRKQKFDNIWPNLTKVLNSK